jgi:hypothetical protein
VYIVQILCNLLLFYNTPVIFSKILFISLEIMTFMKTAEVEQIFLMILVRFEV